MALQSLPAFQRALLKRNAMSKGRGQRTKTSDLSAAFAGDQLRRQLAYRDIALSRTSRLQRNKQFNKSLGIQRQGIQQTEKELPYRIGLGLATSGFAAYQGHERNKMLQESAAATNKQNELINRNIALQNEVLNRDPRMYQMDWRNLL